RYAFGCTTSASVEAGLTHNWPVPERGARREPRRSGATRGRNVPAGCEHGRGSGRWWEAGRDPGQPTGCAGLAAATHEPLVMRQDLLARRARSTTSPITEPSAATSSGVEVLPREKRREPRARASSAPMARRTWLGWATPAV